jgi:VanZ family protein
MTTLFARKRLMRYIPLLLWMAVISFASTNSFSASNTSRFIRPLLIWLFPHISEERIAVFHFFVRKASHFSEYAILGFLAARAFSSSSQRLLRNYWAHASVILIVSYALLDEFHQSFVSSRTASIYDSLIDISGGVFSLLCFAYLKRRKAKN